MTEKEKNERIEKAQKIIKSATILLNEVSQSPEENQVTINRLLDVIQESEEYIKAVQKM